MQLDSVLAIIPRVVDIMDTMNLSKDRVVGIVVVVVVVEVFESA
jgi:putative effector of murein hydrolase LrgA (UPF0299 family)